jgi:hypothetical protein
MNPYLNCLAGKMQRLSEEVVVFGQKFIYTRFLRLLLPLQVQYSCIMYILLISREA